MKPEDIAKAGTEHAHQTALFCWSKQKKQWPELEWMFAVPNGGERNIAVAGRLKAEGVKSGVSDVMLPAARRGYHGLFIEMKKPASEIRKAGKESTKQKEFGAFVKEQGYFYIVCFDWMSAARIVAWYMGVDDGTY